MNDCINITVELDDIEVSVLFEDDVNVDVTFDGTEAGSNPPDLITGNSTFIY